jgi:hypothetical protein
LSILLSLATGGVPWPDTSLGEAAAVPDGASRGPASESTHAVCLPDHDGTVSLGPARCPGEAGPRVKPHARPRSAGRGTGPLRDVVGGEPRGGGSGG